MSQGVAQRERGRCACWSQFAGAGNSTLLRTTAKTRHNGRLVLGWARVGQKPAGSTRSAVRSTCDTSRRIPPATFLSPLWCTCGSALLGLPFSGHSEAIRLVGRGALAAGAQVAAVAGPTHGGCAAEWLAHPGVVTRAEAASPQTEIGTSATSAAQNTNPLNRTLRSSILDSACTPLRRARRPQHSTPRSALSRPMLGTCPGRLSAVDNCPWALEPPGPSPDRSLPASCGVRLRAVLSLNNGPRLEAAGCRSDSGVHYSADDRTPSVCHWPAPAERPHSLCPRPRARHTLKDLVTSNLEKRQKTLSFLKRISGTTNF